MQWENYLNETSMEFILGTLFLILFQARRGLKHRHASIENTTGDSSLDVNNMPEHQ